MLEKTFTPAELEPDKSWNFYLDESGHDGSTPLVVFGGFGIEASLEEDFLQRVLDLYKRCYGHAYDGSYEIKGSKIFENGKIKLLNQFPVFSDNVRGDLATQCMVNSNNSAYFDVNKAALCQAGLKFAAEIFVLLESYNCKFICSTTVKGADIFIRDKNLQQEWKKLFLTKKDRKYTSFLLNELSISVYETIFEFCSSLNIKSFNVIADATNEKDGITRAYFFENSYRIFNKIGHDEWAKSKPKYMEKANFKLIDSQSTLLMQITDVIIYIVNWANGLGFPRDKVISEEKFNLICDIYFENFHKGSSSYDYNKKSHFINNVFIQNKFKPLSKRQQKQFENIKTF